MLDNSNWTYLTPVEQAEVMRLEKILQEQKLETMKLRARIQYYMKLGSKRKATYHKRDQRNGL